MDAVDSDKAKNNDFQDARDMVTLSIIYGMLKKDTEYRMPVVERAGSIKVRNIGGN